jgi:hypothetical protein
LQIERTFPPLPQEETKIDATTIIAASKPRFVKLFKPRLDISATPKVVADGTVWSAPVVAERARRLIVV